MTEYIPNLNTRFPKWVTGWIILVLDILSGWIAFRLCLLDTIIRSGADPYYWFLGIQGIWILSFLISNLFQGEFTTSRIGEFELIIKLTFTFITLAILVQALKLIPFPFSPRRLFLYWLWFVFSNLSFRMIVRTIQKVLLKRGIGREKTAIFGYNHRGARAAAILDEQIQKGYDVLGFIRANDDPKNPPEHSFPVLGNEENLESIIAKHQLSDIVLALDKPDHERLMSVISGINGSPVTVKIVPGLYDVISGLARTEQIVGLPLLEVNLNLESWYVKWFKRILDLVLAIPISLAMLPISGMIALIVRFSSPGPVLYRQVRVGQLGKPYTIYKFRSMIADAEKNTGPVWSEEDDPRITPVGRFLRRFRLDELPQLWNVLNGHMSLVGPRPERPYFVEKLKEEFPFYNRRQRLRPGITGWAQIKHPYDRDIEDVRQKLKYDFYYIENVSLNLDLKIILSTVLVMLTGKGR